mmetsp:Transcript_18383/g.54870  ORF Transcript_18383/g.54870 Transcript_18383/m.54870 type:complete len:200 (+) Transcript_18383:381-980(+)
MARQFARLLREQHPGPPRSRGDNAGPRPQGRHRARLRRPDAVAAGGFAARHALGAPLREAGGLHERPRPPAFRGADLGVPPQHAPPGGARGRPRRRGGRGLPPDRRAARRGLALVRVHDPRRGHPRDPLLRLQLAAHRRRALPEGRGQAAHRERLLGPGRVPGHLRAAGRGRAAGGGRAPGAAGAVLAPRGGSLRVPRS